MMLFCYYKDFSKERDTMSVYFECKNGNIEVHRTYYIYKQFMRNFSSFEKTKIDIKDSVEIYPIQAFYETIKEFDFVKFFNNTNKRRRNSFKNIDDEDLEKDNHTLSNLKERLAYSFDRENQDQIEDIVDELNLLFYGYTLKNCGRLFEKDQLIIEHVNYCFEDAFGDGYWDNVTETPKLPNAYQREDLNLSLRVYKVGQANCSALINKHSEDYDVISVFDLGCDKGNQKNQELINMVNKIDENTTIIISHFDSDHFNYIPYIDLNKTKRWIFPEKPPRGKKAYAVFQQLLSIAAGKAKNGTIYRYRPPYALSNYLTIDQKTDNSKDPYNSTLTNANSIVSIINYSKKVLIPADALYKDFRNTVTYYAPYDYILIPHHGCFYPPNSYCINRLIKNDTVGILCSGKNSYGHASISHLSNYPKVLCFTTAAFFDKYGNRIPYKMPKWFVKTYTNPYIEIHL